MFSRRWMENFGEFGANKHPNPFQQRTQQNSCHSSFLESNLEWWNHLSADASYRYCWTSRYCFRWICTTYQRKHFTESIVIWLLFWLVCLKWNRTIRFGKLFYFYSHTIGYNSSLNAALTNEFITAGFRMGHSMILQQLRQYNVNQTYYGQTSNYMFEAIVFQSNLAYRFIKI